MIPMNKNKPKTDAAVIVLFVIGICVSMLFFGVWFEAIFTEQIGIFWLPLGIALTWITIAISYKVIKHYQVDWS